MIKTKLWHAIKSSPKTRDEIRAAVGIGRKTLNDTISGWRQAKPEEKIRFANILGLNVLDCFDKEG
jgi:hypothetical protein